MCLCPLGVAAVDNVVGSSVQQHKTGGAVACSYAREGLSLRLSTPSSASVRLQCRVRVDVHVRRASGAESWCLVYM
jgi:hypothetical protein